MFPVSALLQIACGVEIAGLKMIHVRPLVPVFRYGGENGVHGVALIGAEGILCPRHGDAVVIARAALGAHQIVIIPSFGQMRRFQAAPIGAAAPDAPGVAFNGFRLRVIFHDTDRAGLFVAVARLPVQRHYPFSAVRIMAQRGVKAGGVQIHGLANSGSLFTSRIKSIQGSRSFIFSTRMEITPFHQIVRADSNIYLLPCHAKSTLPLVLWGTV